MEARLDETPSWGLRAPRCSGLRAKKMVPGIPRPSELRPNVVREMPGEEEREEGVEEYVEGEGGTCTPEVVEVTVMAAKAVVLGGEECDPVVAILEWS